MDIHTTMQKIIISLFLFAVSLPSHAVTITFDEYSYADALEHELSNVYIHEDGYEIYTDATLIPNWRVYGEDHVDYAGSAAIFASGTGALYKRVAPGVNESSYFNAISVDLAINGFDRFYSPVSFVFQGKFYDGRATVSQRFTIDPLLHSFDTFYFNEEFKGIKQLYWYSNNNMLQFDNFNLTAVPLPASVWLLLTGLVGMIGLARRR